MKISKLIEKLQTNERKEVLSLFGISCENNELEVLLCTSLEARLVRVLKKQGDIDCNEIMP